MANSTIRVPHPYRRVEAEYVHTGQGKDYFTLSVDGHLVHDYLEIPAGTRPVGEAVIKAYKEKFPAKEDANS